MSDSAQEMRDFGAVKARLEEIADAVSADDVPLDDALDLFEEAVALGLRAGDLLETNIVVSEESADESGQGASEEAQPQPVEAAN